MRIKGLQFKISISLVAAFALCLLIPAFGQSPTLTTNKPPEPPGPNPKQKPVVVKTDLVQVYTTVTDPYRRLVTGLDRENFQLFEDGVEQEVTKFSSEDVPVSIGIVFDMSGSMSDKVNKARQSAIQFLRTSNPQDEFTLVSFNEHAELTSRFTSSVEDLQTRMMYTVARGRTALLDAVYLGLSQMRSAHNSKKALLIISDGGDNHSRYSEHDVRNFVKESDAQIYAMGIFDQPGRTKTEEEKEGPSLLGELCDLTGGRVFPVDDLDQLPDIATKIGMELRNQYVLYYSPSNKNPDGRWRKIKIKVHPPRGLPPLTVYSRSGYFGPDH